MGSALKHGDQQTPPSPPNHQPAKSRMSRRKPPNILTRRKLEREQNLDQNQLPRGFTVGSNDGVERHSYHHYHELHEIPICYEQTRPAQNNELLRILKVRVTRTRTRTRTMTLTKWSGTKGLQH